jgi:hypothetical protein
MSWSGNKIGLGKAIDGVKFGDGLICFPLHERINIKVRPNWGSTDNHTIGPIRERDFRIRKRRDMEKLEPRREKR